MLLKQVIEKFQKNPKYMSNGAGQLSRKWNCTKEDIYNARQFVKANLKAPETKNLPKILILDIETAPMRAYVWQRWKQNIYLEQTISEFFIISWAAKWLYSANIMSEVISPQNIIEENDKEVVSKLWDLIDEADIIVAHNGDAFDLPYINSRFIVNGLKPPKPYQTIDTKKVAAKEFRFSSNKLDALAGYFNIGAKIETNFELWSECMKGNQTALNNMVIYNRHDVEITEEVYIALRPWIKSHPNVNLYTESDKFGCSACGKENIRETDSYYYTTAGKYKVYECECGAHTRGRKNLITNKETLTISIAK